MSCIPPPPFWHVWEWKSECAGARAQGNKSWESFKNFEVMLQ